MKEELLPIVIIIIILLVIYMVMKMINRKLRNDMDKTKLHRRHRKL